MTGFYKDYADSSDTHQNSAEASADAAEDAKLIAQSAESTATAKAIEATNAASQAETFASQAQTSASQAQTFASQAGTSESEAATSASEAATSANDSNVVTVGSNLQNGSSSTINIVAANISDINTVASMEDDIETLADPSYKADIETVASAELALSKTVRWTPSDQGAQSTYPIYYKVATVNKGSGGLHMKGNLSNHVESYGSGDFDLTIFGREGNSNSDIEIHGSFNIASEGTGVLVVRAANNGTQDTYDVYVALTQYSQATVDLTPEGNTQVFTPTTGTTTKPKAVVSTDEMESTLRAVNIIPAAGEFIYGTTEYQREDGLGGYITENKHTSSGDTDFVHSLDNLEEVASNVDSASLVVSWFGDSLDATVCTVKPKVDNSNKVVTPSDWVVSGETRSTADVVSQYDGKAAFGGTPSDKTIREAVAEMKSRGLRVMFYPFLMMDMTNYPWRGQIEGNPTNFLGSAAHGDFSRDSNGVVTYSGTEEWTQRRMILHYATLLGDLMTSGDAFLVGSEMVGLSRDQAGWGTGLASLMGDVRQKLASGVKVSYAGDWSEYQMTNLSSAWTAADFIGIDWYMPLTDWRSSADAVYTRDAFKAGMTSGEYWDYYYADEAGREANNRLAITSDQYRQKNVGYWRDNNHSGKDIWLTEFGCAAVDKGGNQPNVFVDPKSSSSALPYFSDGSHNETVQRLYIEAMLEYFGDNSSIVDPANMFVWTWDARPYPEFPNQSEVWGDSQNWKNGHWVTGRLGGTNAELDTTEHVEGSYVVSDSMVYKNYHSGVFTDNSSNWDTAYYWGDHGAQGYTTQTYVDSVISDDLSFVDGKVITLGTDNDFKIYHDGSSSIIKDEQGNQLYMQSTNFNLSNSAGLKHIYANDSYGLTLYYQDDPKLETQNGGIGVTGNITVTGTVDGVDIATLNSNAIVDGDFTTAGIMTTDGNGVYSVDTNTYLTTHQDISGKANLSGATFTGNVSIGTLPSDTRQLSVTGAANLYGGANLQDANITGVDTLTAKNVVISTLGSVTTNISTGTLGDESTPTKIVNIGTGFHNGGTTTVNICPTSSTTNKNINLNGNVSVDGTVDGRYVATDGIKLDALERVYRTRFRHRNAEHSTFQNLTNIIADIGNPVYTKSTTGSENTLEFFLATSCSDYYDNNDGNIEVVITAPDPANEDVVDLGTASNIVQGTPSGQFNFDVVGDVTKHLTDYCGMSVNSDGSSAFAYDQVRSNAYYNPSTNKTTISCNQYQTNKPTSGDNVYLHPFDWESSGTALIGNRIQIDEVVYNGQKMSRKDFRAYLGYFKSSLTIKIRGKEGASTTDNISIRKMEGVITQIQD